VLIIAFLLIRRAFVFRRIRLCVLPAVLELADVMTFARTEENKSSRKAKDGESSEVILHRSETTHPL